MLTDTATDTQELVLRVLQKMRRDTRGHPSKLFNFATGESLHQFCMGLVRGEMSVVNLIRQLRQHPSHNRKHIADRSYYRFAERFLMAFEEDQEARDRADLLAFSTASVAQRLELEPDQVESLIRRGQLATVSLGGIRRVPAASLRRLLAFSASSIPKRGRLALRDR